MEKTAPPVDPLAVVAFFAEFVIVIFLAVNGVLTFPAVEEEEEEVGFVVTSAASCAVTVRTSSKTVCKARNIPVRLRNTWSSDLMRIPQQARARLCPSRSPAQVQRDSNWVTKS